MNGMEYLKKSEAYWIAGGLVILWALFSHLTITPDTGNSILALRQIAPLLLLASLYWAIAIRRQFSDPKENQMHKKVAILGFILLIIYGLFFGM